LSPDGRSWSTLTRPLALGSLVAILLLAAFLRIDGLRWDAACRTEGEAAETGCSETHLHPDERFLTMVASAIEIPTSLGDYLDTKSSPANPHNRGFQFFPYGTLPVLTVRALASAVRLADYDQIHLVGRIVSAACSLLTIGILFILASRLYDRTVALFSALLLALAVLPIQQAHFFTVDAMATTASMLALLAALGIAHRGRWRDFLGFGIALGVAVAIKVSAFTLALLAVAAALESGRKRRGQAPPARSGRRPAAAGLALAALTSLVLFRLLSPYAFEGPGFLGIGLNPAWSANMREVSELVSGWRDFPPGHQWTGRVALWFPWRNMVLVGFGPALGIAAWLGWTVAGWLLLWRRQKRHLLPWLWVTILFVHQGTQWVKSMRYFLPIYPTLALFAAFLLVEGWRRARRTNRLLPRLAAGALIGSVVLGTAAWAWAFTAIYRRPHSRIEASRWIYQNAAEGSAIATETWDDALPLPLDGLPGMARYRGLPLHPYAEDSPQKLDELLATLDRADYLVLSSNRAYDSIPRLPMRYPMTVRYYDALFSGALGFQRVAEFTSYPTLFGRSFPDQSAEEAFSVYDHPRVQIFARTGRWDPQRARAQLDRGDWGQILTLSPREAGRYSDLALPAERLSSPAHESGQTPPELRSASAPDSTLFPAGRHASVSLGLWILCLEWLGLAAFLIAAPALRALSDRGWLLSKSIGLLLFAWLGWFAGSLGAWRFTPSNLRRWLVVLTASALVAGWLSRRDLARFMRERWRLLLTEEALFWSFFCFLLAIRYLNPDLWHPFRGGEKPMDFAFFNAVVRSGLFPPHDPWFAGGAINYYYFGFVLSGALSLLTRVPTEIACNLALPTFFALTAAGAMTAARELAAGDAESRPFRYRSLGWGVAGAAAVLLVGNQGVPRLFAEKIAQLSTIDFPSRIPLLPDLARGLDGALRWAAGARLEIQDHWLYWTASRAIPHPATEPVPITEFPLFTFLFGDLHAHLMAMPVTLLVLALLVSLVRRPGPQAAALDSRLRLAFEEAATLALMALAIGALAATNTWDLPTLLGLAGGALLVRELRRASPARAAGRAVWRLGAVALAGRLLFLPFHLHFVPGYGRLVPWQGSRTSLSAFLSIHALFLLPIVTWLLLERRPWRRATRARSAAGDAARSIELWALAATVPLALLGFRLEALLVALLALSAALFLAPGTGGRARFVATLVAAGALLSLTVEHLVVAGDVGRMNTVFKFYLQIWILWALASIFALVVLQRRWRDFRRERRQRRTPRWILAWMALAILLLIGAASYPLLAIPARVRDRFEGATGRGLDGRAFMDTAVFHEERGAIELRWDAEAIRWLERHVQGTPVILEATTPTYRWGSRISVHTGLPTVLGWDWHERQQRAILKNDPIGQRQRDVATIYGDPSTPAVLPLLSRYRIRFIVVGRLERLYYPASGLDKFDLGTPFREVYRNPEVVIYAVGPQTDPDT